MSTTQLSKGEMIQRIKKLGGVYEPESNLSIEDQLLICETIIESTPVDSNNSDGRTILSLKEKNIRNWSVDVDVNGNDYGGYKRIAFAELFVIKKDIIEQLRKCRSRTTTIVQISSFLEDLFIDYPTNKPGYWFDVARYYTPRVINRVIAELQKLSSPNHETIRNPAAYFTFLIRKRKRKIIMKRNY